MKKIIILNLFCFALLVQCTKQTLPTVELKTSLGDILIEVDTINAPISANNFLRHVNNGTYTSAVFYRVVRADNQPYNSSKIEVIQGGVYVDSIYQRIPTIRHETTKETGLKHLDGTISMARLEPGTASTEFFICIGNQPALDFQGTRNPDKQGFAAFGHVLKGMDVVRKIQSQKDKEQMLLERIKIISIKQKKARNNSRLD